LLENDKYSMSKNAESLNNSLFELLRSRGYEPTLLGTDGKEIPVPDEAEVFQFHFKKDEEDYGPVTISIDGLNKLVIYYGDSVAKSPSGDSESGDVSWYTLLKHLKRFAHQHQLSFELKNTDHLKYDMAKREHMKKIDEGYYPMGKKASYSDSVPQVKIILQHSRQLEEGERRYRAIERIFVENANGERFLLDTKKPGLARVYARHIAEGGTPYDEQGKHIHSLCEEYTKMAGFVRATRNGQFNESAQSLVNEGINHYNNLRETLHKMSGHRGYTAYFESWSPTLTEDEDTTDLSEMFASTALDPRIESVMPILNKLKKNISEVDHSAELSEWADGVIDESLGLAEVSNELLGRYKKNAGHQASTADAGAAGAYSAGSSGKDLGDRLTKLGNKRFKGIVKATNKEFANDLRPKQVAEADGLESNNPEGIPEAAGAAPWAANTKKAMLASKKAQQTRSPADHGRASKAHAYAASDPWHPNADFHKEQAAKHSKLAGVKEGLDSNQMAAGQAGPTDKAPLRGKLVGACERVDQEPDELEPPTRKIIKSYSPESAAEMVAKSEAQGWVVKSSRKFRGGSVEVTMVRKTQGVAEAEEQGIDNKYRRAAKEMITVYNTNADVKDKVDASTDPLEAMIYTTGVVRNPERLAGTTHFNKLMSELESIFYYGRQQGVAEGAESHSYVCVHVKKGKCEVTASSSYEAAKKAAEKWKLKSTSGIDAHLADKPKNTASLEEGSDPLSVTEGQGDFNTAILNLEGWHQDQYNTDPDVEAYEFDDNEGGYYAQGRVTHDLSTGEITIDFEDMSGHYGNPVISGTYDSVGDAMNALRQITSNKRSTGGKAPNFDTLGNKTLAGPDDLYKTDKAGKKGTLTKDRMRGMKASSPSTMRGGPQGVLPEGMDPLAHIIRLSKG